MKREREGGGLLEMCCKLFDEQKENFYCSVPKDPNEPHRLF